MMTNDFKSNPFRLLQWQKRRSLYFALTATGAWALIDLLGYSFLQLPAMPLSVLGAAIGIFASFRSNQAYDRWWEGRKLWGRMINSSRHFSDQVMRYVGGRDAAAAEELIIRHAIYVHTLRALLRKEPPAEDPEILRLADEQTLEVLRTSTNATHALQDLQLQRLTALADAGLLTEQRLESFDRTLMDLLNIQGGCERIKGTPLPRGYGLITELLVNIFAALLPFALVHDLHAMAIPMNVLICLAFALINEAGRVLEDPFTMFFNGLPLKALSIKIERNIRERLGHDELPPPVQASALGVLM